jgi:hypothetical protein
MRTTRLAGAETVSVVAEEPNDDTRYSFLFATGEPWSACFSIALAAG